MSFILITRNRADPSISSQPLFMEQYGSFDGHASDCEPRRILIMILNIPGVCFTTQQLLMELNVPFADDAHTCHLGLRAA